MLIAGPGGSNLYYAGLLRAARHHRQRLPRRHLQIGGRALSPAATCRPRRAQASQALADALWETWQQDVGQARPRAQIAAYVADPAALHRRRPAATWRGRRCDAGLVDRIGDRTRSAGAWPSSPATDEATCPAAIARSITTPGSTSIRRATSGGQIGILTVAGEIVDGHAGPGTAGGETIAAQSRARARGRRPQGAGRAGRFAGRLGARLGADPARDPRRQGARHAGGDLDGLGRGVGRLLDRDRRRHHLRRALDDHRLDRRVRHPAELRGHARSSSASAPTGCGRRRCRASPICCAAPRPRRTGCCRSGSRAPIAASSAWSRGRGACRRRGSTRSRQGRVWDGGTARQLGLVDRFGSLDDAIAEAARRAELDPADARPVYLEQEPGFCSPAARRPAPAATTTARAPRDAFARLARRPEAMIERALHDAQRLLAGPAIQARCLECPAIAPVPRAAAPSGVAAGRGCSPWSGGVRIRRATADDAAAIASIYAPYVPASAVSFETEAPDAAEMRGRIAAGGDALSLAGRLRRGRAGARLCLCRRLPRPAGLPLHASRRRSMSPTARTGAASARAALPRAAAGARGAGLRPGDRRDHPAQQASVTLHERLGFRAGRHLREGRLQARRMAQRRPLAARRSRRSPTARRSRKPVSPVWDG